MAPKLSYTTRSFPARLAELGFSVQLPHDWISHDLPTEDVDFSDPVLFAPLAVVTAPHSAIVFAFAARPAFDDGTLHDWACYLLNENHLKPRAIGIHQIGLLRGVVGEATQESDLGTMLVRFAFIEDGQRLINITLTAPELLAEAVQAAWFKALDTFVLTKPRGSTAATESPTSGAKTSAAPVAAVEPASAKPAPSEPSPSALSHFAIASDSASLDPETSINANLRNKGVGLVPRLVIKNEAAKTATLAAAAIVAQFEVPYGWHVIDDGKRTLIFEPSGKVQINLNLIPREGRNDSALLDVIEAAARADYPEPEFCRVNLGKIHALGVRNIMDGAQPLEQYHLLFPTRDEQMVLRARVTCAPEQSTDACNLAEAILASCVFGFTPAPEAAKTEAQTPSESLPDWWQQALALEAAGQVKQAEEIIKANTPHDGSSASFVEMYRQRMMRLKEAGDDAGALEAFLQSSNRIYFYSNSNHAPADGAVAAPIAASGEFYAELLKAYGGRLAEAR